MLAEPATRQKVMILTMSAAKATAEAIASRRQDPVRVWSLQEIHGAG